MFLLSRTMYAPGSSELMLQIMLFFFAKFSLSFNNTVHLFETEICYEMCSVRIRCHNAVLKNTQLV